MRSGADLRDESPLVSFNHVIDPHYVTFSSSLYTTIRNPNFLLLFMYTSYYIALFYISCICVLYFLYMCITVLLFWCNKRIITNLTLNLTLTLTLTLTLIVTVQRSQIRPGPHFVTITESQQAGAVTDDACPRRATYVVYRASITAANLPVSLVRKFVAVECRCWTKNAGSYQWIIYMPNLACLVVSFSSSLNINLRAKLAVIFFYLT